MNRLTLHPSLHPSRSALFHGLLLALLPLQAARADEPAAAPAAAPEAAAPAAPSSSWGLGLGVFTQQQVYRDVDDDVQALPLVSYENRWFRFQLPNADLKLLPAGPWDLALRLRYDGSGYEASDSPALAGMEKRKGGLWAGAALQWRTLATLGLEVSGDASGNSNGVQAKLSLSKDFRLGRLGLTPRVAVTWMDDKYVDYYYGVAVAEALATRPAYTGLATVNTEVGLRAGYGFTRTQAMFVDVSTTQLGQEIQDSPLVDRSTQAGARVGYLYRF
jgi:outer membrane protein